MQAEIAAKRTTAIERAKDWLRGFLANGSVPAEVVLEQAKADGIAEKTLRRASKTLGVLTEKVGMTGGWYWSLAPKAAKDTEDAQASGLATFGEVGHVRETECGAQLDLGTRPVEYPD
jgi:hypothetical protein